MLIVLIYIKRPKQLLEAGAGFPAEPSPMPFKGESSNPRGGEKKRISAHFAGFCQNSELGLNIHCLILRVRWMSPVCSDESETTQPGEIGRGPHLNHLSPPLVISQVV